MSQPKANEKVVYCQIDAHLDSNPKIRKAGRDARDIFEFILRRTAIARTEGTVPISYIDPEYLADQLMMTCDEARHGTSRASQAKLIEVDHEGGLVRVVGWSAEWSRRPKDGRERTAAWRAKQAELQGAGDGGDEVRHTPSQVTGGDESDAREEKRREESKSPDKRDTSLAGILILEIIKNNPRHTLARMSDAEKGKRIDRWANHVRLMREVDHHTEQEILEVIRWCQADSFWRGNIQSTEKLREKWDTLIAQMERSGKRPAPKPVEQPTLTFRIGDVEVQR